jgi:tetratricopeptide (TPR) repeat protein
MGSSNKQVTTMTASLVRALALGAALVSAPAFAQSAAPSAPDLPSEAKVTPFRPRPNVGAVPGSTIEMVDLAGDCSKDARKVADGLMAPGDALRVCSDAITSGMIDQERLAGTFVNRGVLLMTMARPDDAKKDMERALTLRPELAEAYVNRGVLLVQAGRAAEALVDLDKGIALGPEEPERAYYNRGLAREDLRDIKGAYADYKMASEIRPGWEPVQTELSRFRVVNK